MIRNGCVNVTKSGRLLMVKARSRGSSTLGCATRIKGSTEGWISSQKTAQMIVTTPLVTTM